MSAASDTAPAVVHEPAASRFVAMVDGQACVCDYQLVPGGVRFTHTGVPAHLGGRGIAAALVEKAVAWADAQGLAIDPACSYVAVWLRRRGR